MPAFTFSRSALVPAVLAQALRSIGKFKNPAGVKTLTDYLVHSEPMVVAGLCNHPRRLDYDAARSPTHRATSPVRYLSTDKSRLRVPPARATLHRDGASHPDTSTAARIISPALQANWAHA